MNLLCQGLLGLCLIAAITGCDSGSDQTFNYCIASILQHEGGLSDDKRDPGGITNWGISLRFLRAQNIDIDGDGDSDDDDIRALTEVGSKEIYRKYWWNKYQYNRFMNKDIACKVFDMSVNMGSKSAHIITQQAINSIISPDIKVDGVIGAKTFYAANHINPIILLELLRLGARKRYMDIIEHNPRMEVYKTGWMNRAAW